MSGSQNVYTRLGRNMLVKLAAEGLGRVATFGLTLWAARQLGEATFGLYSYGLALGFVLAQIADMGLQVLMAREVAVMGWAARPVIRTALRLKFWLSLAVLLFLFLFLFQGDQSLSVQFSFLLLGLAMLAQTYLEFAAYIFRGQQRLVVEARVLTLARLLVAIVGALVLWQGGGLMGLAISNVLGVGLATAWAMRLLRQEAWLTLSAASEPPLQATAPPWSSLLRQALPLGLATFFSIAYTRLAILLLQLRLGEVAVAHFSAAHRLVEPTQLLPAVVLAAVFPAYASALHQNPRQAGRLGVGTTVLLAGAGGVLALVLWLAGPVLVSFFYGPAYGESAPVLQLLGLSAIPAFVNYSLTHYLIARGQQLYSSLFMVLMLLVHGALSWHLIPTMGAAGPAVSVVVAETILLACCLTALFLTKPMSLKGTVQWQTSV